MRAAALLSSLLVSGLLAGTAMAQSGIPQGLWSYQVRYMIGPVPARDSGTYCVDRAMAATSYEALLNQVNPRCSVSNSAMRADGYHFTLRCKGGPDGELDGRLQVGENEAAMNASGWTGTPSENVPVSLIAGAQHVAPVC